MTVLARMKVLLTADIGKFETDMVKAAKRMDSTGKKMESAGRKLTLGVTTPLVALGAVSVDAASDLNESMSKVQVVFGDSAAVVTDFAETAADKLGMSQQAALEAAGTFGNLFTTMHIGQRASANMSIGLVQLAGDLASFNNLKPEEVLLKLRSGLVGEVEPLRAIGVNLSQATVQAKALEMGLADANGTVSQAGLVQARYALILDQTRTAQGDYARTSNGLANSTRSLTAKLKDVESVLGKQLLPVELKNVGALSDLLGKFDAMPEAAQHTAVNLAVAAAAAGPLLIVSGKLVTMVGSLTTAITAAGSVTAFFAASVAPVLLMAGALATLGLAIHTVTKAVKIGRQWQDRLSAAFTAHEYVVRRNSGSYEDYVDEMLRAAVAGKKLTDTEALVYKHMLLTGKAQYVVRDGMRIVGRAAYDQTQQMAAVSDSFDQAIVMMDGYDMAAIHMQDTQAALAESSQQLAMTQDQFQGKLDMLHLAIDGPVSRAYNDWMSQQDDLESQMKDVGAQIDELRGKSWLSADEKKKLDDLTAQYGDLNQALDDSTAAYQRQRAEIAYNIAEKLILDAVDKGLLEDTNNNGTAYDEAYNALSVLSKQMGLTDQATLDFSSSVITLTDNFISGKSDLTDYADHMDDLAKATKNIETDIHVKVRIDVTGDLPNIPRRFSGQYRPMPQAAGGDWLVRKPTLFLAGEAGAERATFTPLPVGGGVDVAGVPSRGGVQVTIQYAPAVSLGDRWEAENVLAPLVRDAVREVEQQ